MECLRVVLCVLAAIAGYRPVLGVQCEAGWFDADGTCYTVIPIPKSYLGAAELCKSSSFGGDIVQLETIQEKAALVSHMKTTYSLIFTGQLFWVGAKGGKSVFVWNNGTPLTYPDFVDGTGQGVGCLAFGATTLNKYQVDPCINPHLVICEKSANQTTTSTAPPQVGR